MRRDSHAEIRPSLKLYLHMLGMSQSCLRYLGSPGWTWLAGLGGRMAGQAWVAWSGGGVRAEGLKGLRHADRHTQW